MSIFDIDIPKDHLQDETDATAAEDSTQSNRSNAYIYRQYGGFNQFLLVYGLKMSNPDDVEEGKAIATEMRRADEQEAREATQQQRTQAQQQPTSSSDLPAKSSTSIRKPRRSNSSANPPRNPAPLTRAKNSEKQKNVISAP